MTDTAALAAGSLFISVPLPAAQRRVSPPIYYKNGAPPIIRSQKGAPFFVHFAEFKNILKTGGIFWKFTRYL